MRSRSWYLFHRFIRPIRSHVGSISQMVIEAIGDLLAINAELPEDNSDDDMSSDEEDKSADAMFTAQLYLFEAIGCISTASTVPDDNKVLYARSVVGPLLADLERNLDAARSGDERALLQVHHIVEALGTLVKGYSETMATGSGAQQPSGVFEEFSRASEAILAALESLSTSMQIRTAARFAFSRLMTVLGTSLLQQLPRWIRGFLSQSASKDEMAMFLRVLDQVVHTYKAEIYGILDELLTPLLQRIFAALAEPTGGTDDEIQLAELRREYLQFVLVILNHDLGSVLVSNSKSSSSISR